MIKENLTVLLIEDNVGDAFMIKFYLEESQYANYTIKHEEELESGIELAKKEKFDIILLDLHFANSQGIETLQKFQREVPNQFVIVMTGMYDEEIGLDALKLGAQDYMVKGNFDNKIFNTSLKFAFERHKFNYHYEVYSIRFHQMQRMLNAGYFEFLPNENFIFLSTILAAELLNSEKKEIVLEEFAQFFNERQEVIDLFKINLKNGHYEFSIKETNQKATIILELNNNYENRIAGMLKF